MSTDAKTPDELADDAVAVFLQRFEELLSWGERRTREIGIPESDLDRLIHEARAEHR